MAEAPASAPASPADAPARQGCTVRAPAKINLHLEVLGLRPDGFHELAMVMQTLDLADRLRIRPRSDGMLQLRCDRPGLPTGADNLILQAAQALRQRCGGPALGADIELEKRIPVGAGLAGGSSDAAAALVGLDAAWGLQRPAEELLELAAALGSDVPYCLVGGTRLCFGRGEVLEDAGVGVPPLGVLLIKHPDAQVSTPWAYRRFRDLREDYYLQAEADFERRREALRRGALLRALASGTAFPPLRNDLQQPVAAEVESVATGLTLLGRCQQALAVAMSGSGPSLYALFPTPEQAGRARGELAGELAAAGFESWCCRCTGSGATLEPPEDR
ncbi:MAG: 4-(cytidine 5'-diphospho)-2-C-methyl-D-erythritol kinase [Synechococcaceae cyanobacterium]|nr:4-(cytidine 5'-diphospho)-2-C-methyl-D-erythritol kinase [Synechococcaceae cyanobacterium]